MTPEPRYRPSPWGSLLAVSGTLVAALLLRPLVCAPAGIFDPVGDAVMALYDPALLSERWLAVPQPWRALAVVLGMGLALHAVRWLVARLVYQPATESSRRVPARWLRLSFLATVAVLALGTIRWPLSIEPIRPRQASDPNLVLYVSNQSFHVDPVDIRVRIDGEVVLDDRFEVGNQHGWRAFPLRLPAGQHVVEVDSRRGRSRASVRLAADALSFVVVDYWFYPWDESTPRHLRVQVERNIPIFL